jgi:hypothetical protein
MPHDASHKLKEQQHHVDDTANKRHLIDLLIPFLQHWFVSPINALRFWRQIYEIFRYVVHQNLKNALIALIFAHSEYNRSTYWQVQ